MKRSIAVALATLLAIGTIEGAAAEPNRNATSRTFTVVSSGDILLHERTWNQARRDSSTGAMNFDPQFADVKPLFASADLALCHLETPIAKKGTGYRGYPAFNVPPQIIGTIRRLGFDMCGTASNHSFDAGSAGIKRTLDALDAAGIKHTGSARTAAESTVPLVMTVQTDGGPVKVGIIAFTYGFNGIAYPSGHRWAANKINATRIIAAARAARAAGAEIVIAKLHWGSEYTARPNLYQRRLTATLARSGVIDLIDGAHSHSVQPIQKVGDMAAHHGRAQQAGAEDSDHKQHDRAGHQRHQGEAPGRDGCDWEHEAVHVLLRCVLTAGLAEFTSPG